MVTEEKKRKGGEKGRQRKRETVTIKILYSDGDSNKVIEVCTDVQLDIDRR